MGKVLIFSHNFPPALDGGAKLLSLIALEQERKGREVLVITSDAYLTDEYLNPKAGRIRKIGKIGGIKVIRLWTWRWGKPIIRRITGPIFLWLPWKKLLRFRPQKIISGVFPTLAPFYAWILARILNSELILVPCFHQEEPGFRRQYLLWLLKQADQIWALTKKEREFYQEQLGIKKSKIKIYYPHLNSEIILSRNRKANFPEPRTIIFVGAQAAHKRIGLLVEAFQRLKRKLRFKLRLILIGPKTLFSPRIEAKIRQLPKKIKKDILVLGRVSEKKKIELLDQAWVLVNPSIHESLGLVFFEAWARKKPVIAARISVLEEVINDGQDGLLFDKNNLDDLVKKIKTIITNKNLARKMGERGYQKILRLANS